ncbi:MAG: hypothetical protein KJS97_12785 [Alphaproteobacteria bacterium]|nr:hypothetical protein [Alphaproteobacteria bacterium]
MNAIYVSDLEAELFDDIALVFRFGRPAGGWRRASLNSSATIEGPRAILLFGPRGVDQVAGALAGYAGIAALISPAHPSFAFDPGGRRWLRYADAVDLGEQWRRLIVEERYFFPDSETG